MIALVPHIVRTPDYSAENLRGIYAGTDQVVKINYAPKPGEVQGSILQPGAATPVVAAAVQSCSSGGGSGGSSQCCTTDAAHAVSDCGSGGCDPSRAGLAALPTRGSGEGECYAFGDAC